MNKEMIISSSDHDTRVAILEDDQVVEIFIERERSRGVVGNIYKGRVSKVLPGMQSSFIDVGLERDAFLYVTEVVNTVEEFDRLESGEDEDDEDDERGTDSSPALAVAGEPTVADPDAFPAADSSAAGGAERRRPRRTPRPRPGPRRARPRQAGAENRGPAQGRPGDPRSGRQGAARHQGRAAHLARHHAWPLPGLHADGRPRRRVAQDRIAGRARAPARHRQVLPRAARLHRRRDHPHRRLRPLGRGHRQRPLLVPPDLDRDPPEDGSAPGAGRALPGAEPGRQAAARSAHRRLHGHPHRRRAGAPPRHRAGRADHAEPGAAGEALHEELSRSSRSTASRPRSTRPCAARCG